MRSMVIASSLVKRYGTTNVVDGVQLSIHQGECFGLLGPNGAGKTSTMRMLYGSSRPSAGEIVLSGLKMSTHAQEIKRLVGVVPQEDGLDPDFSVVENLLVYCRYHGIVGREAHEKSIQLLKEVDLFEKRDSLVPTLSGGMKRRLCIARALINQPQILFLDEPTTGLDPQARHWIWSKVRELKKKGITVVLTTHYMDEAERLCDRIAIMERGQVFVVGQPRELIERIVGHEVVEFEYEPKERDFILSRLGSLYEIQVLPEKILLFLKSGQDGKSALNLIASETMTVRRATLEDVFLKTTGHQLRDK